MRLNRSHSGVDGIVGSGAGSSSIPVTILPSAFSDQSASRSPYGRLCTWKVEPLPSSQRMQGQLHLARILLGQNDRLIEEDLADLRRRPGRGQGHRRVRRARNDDGAVDDVMLTATAAI